MLRHKSASSHTLPAQIHARLAAFCCAALLLFSINHCALGQGAAYSLWFDGQNDYVELGDQFGDLTVPFSVSVWVRLDRDGEYFILRSDDVADDNKGVHSGVLFNIYGGDEIAIHYGDGLGSGYGNRRAKRVTVQYLVGKWHHVAGVVRGESDMSIYVDGVDVGGSHEGNGGPMSQNMQPARLARNTLFTTTFLRGELDEFRLWDIALTGEQVRAEMHRNLQSIPPELAAYFTFDTGEDQWVHGRSNAGITGTLGATDIPANDDPSWARSLAPIGSSGCVGSRHDVAAIWRARHENQSAGLQLQDDTFIDDEGDFIVFGHNNLEAGFTDANLSALVDQRWNRTWCIDYSDPGPSKGGLVSFIFDPVAAGFESVLLPDESYRLLFRGAADEDFEIVTTTDGEPLIHTEIDERAIFFVDLRDAKVGSELALDGEFTLGLIDQPLPVELTTFTGFLNDTQPVLQWETASELNNAGFEMQRSNNGVVFSTIGFIEGKGTSLETNRYRYTDITPILPSTDSLFYRLKQIDFDGTFSYAPAILVPLPTPQSIHLAQNAPNPFNPQTSINYSISAAGHVRLKVFDILGREVAILVDGFVEAGYHEVHFNARHLPSGPYIYQLQSQDVITTRIMTLSR